MPFYVTRYKSTRTGIRDVYHSAQNDARAAESALRWCNSEPGRQHIRTDPFVTFSDDILDQTPQADAGRAAASKEEGARRSAPSSR